MSPDGFARVAIHPASSSTDEGPAAAAAATAAAAAEASSAFELRPRLLVNASGLGALELARVGSLVSGRMICTDILYE
jgi:hypothetical protein